MNVKIGILATGLLIVLASCTSSQHPNTGGKASTQKANQTTAPADTTKKTTKSHGKKVTWQVFNHAGWKKDFYGLKINIEQIALTKQIPNIQLGKKTPAIRVQFKMHNSTSKKKFELHPVRAKLTTSKGKEIKAAAYISDPFKGEIAPGETKEATVGFYLPNDADVTQIKWIKIDTDAKRIWDGALKRVKDEAIYTGPIALK